MSFIRTIGTICILATAALVWASEADQLREKANAMKREAAQLADRGHRQEAENLQRRALSLFEEADRLEHRVDVEHDAEFMEHEPHRLPHARHRENEPDRQRLAERLEHMRIAVEHLHQAGLNEIAEHVAQQAAATERELDALRPQHQRDAIHEVMKQIDEIRREVHRLAAEVNRLQQNQTSARKD
ncbi:MAG: hypothetical protein R3C05_17725 [Pirellulaceae bacterium]